MDYQNQKEILESYKEKISNVESSNPDTKNKLNEVINIMDEMTASLGLLTEIMKDSCAYHKRTTSKTKYHY